jgi:hypothetical protein
LGELPLGDLMPKLDMTAQGHQGWGGRSPRFWGKALRLQDERLAATYQEVTKAPRGSEERADAFDRLHLEAHFLLIALAHMLRLLEAFANALDDDHIKAIRDDFRKGAPWIKNFRDVLEHLDEYEGGKGKLRKLGEIDDRAVMVLTFGPFERPFEVVAQLGQWRLPLRAAAETGQRLGLLLAGAWEERFGTGQPRFGWGRAP